MHSIVISQKPCQANRSVLPLFSDDAWILDETAESDIDLLMKWFPDADATRIWGGPDFRHPFNRHSFVEDIHWGRMATFSLHSPSAELAAFGQIYERLNRINLARLAVNPTMRGQGIGRRLIEMLMTLVRRCFPALNSRYSSIVTTLWPLNVMNRWGSKLLAILTKRFWAKYATT